MAFKALVLPDVAFLMKVLPLAWFVHHCPMRPVSVPARHTSAPPISHLLLFLHIEMLPVLPSPTQALLYLEFLPHHFCILLFLCLGILPFSQLASSMVVRAFSLQFWGVPQWYIAFTAFLTPSIVIAP